MYLDSKLKRRCLLSKRFHLSECTHDNIQALQNQSTECPIASISGNPLVKVVQKRTRPGGLILWISLESSLRSIPEDSGLMTDDCSSIGDFYDGNTECKVKKNVMTVSKDVVCNGLTYAESDLLIGPSNCK
ncbi:hypothetical protein VNO77_25799 [Canavalia gladiata]|uniref:Uncharacterized protein n=1 Tax=Canavalia gladiata TaxID=3824 RepID=A0AAN9KR81_CANGL